MEIFRRKHAEKIRYGLVGATNTLIDFGILFFLSGIGVDKLASNYISTSAAFLFSFVVNKNYTFKSKGSNTRKEFGLFTLVTLSGLWILQPLIIAFTLSVAESMAVDGQIGLVVAKIIATIVTLIWNYVLYSRVVFKKGIL
jgi:putative flippase GtrA